MTEIPRVRRVGIEKEVEALSTNDEDVGQCRERKGMKKGGETNGVRKVGPPKISSSRQVEEENPQGRADDRKNLVCRKAHKILRAGGARNVEKGRPHSGGVRQPSSRRKRQCGFINTKTPGFVVSQKAK